MSKNPEGLKVDPRKIIAELAKKDPEMRVCLSILKRHSAIQTVEKRALETPAIRILKEVGVVKEVEITMTSAFIEGEGEEINGMNPTVLKLTKEGEKVVKRVKNR